MNKRNLTKLLKHLEKQRNSKASAGRFNMAYWGEATDYANTQVLEIPVCKTQACMAGEATIALGATEFLKNGGLKFTTATSNKFPGINSIAGVAGGLLGLISIQQQRLFYLKLWAMQTAGRRSTKMRIRKRRPHEHV